MVSHDSTVPEDGTPNTEYGGSPTPYGALEWIDIIDAS